MRICLIFPRYKYPCGDPPLGIAYLKSYLEKYTNAKITLIDTTFHKDYKQIVSILNKKQFDLIGFSAMYSMVKDTINLTYIARKVQPNAKIMWGGPFPTIAYKKILQKKLADLVVIGEGEIPFEYLIKNKLNLKGIKGIASLKKNGEIEYTEESNKPDITNLPFPDRSELPMKKYIEHWYKLSTVGNNFKGTNIITSRGCPYNCTYCQPSINKIFGCKLRTVSPKTIIHELKHLKKTYKINSFQIEDDNFAISSAFYKDFVKEYQKHNLNLLWSSIMRADLITDEKLSLFKQIGLIRISFGIESISNKIRNEVYKKNISKKSINNALHLTKKHKIKTHGFIMIGAPKETYKKMLKTIHWAASSSLNDITISITNLIPGTGLGKNSNTLKDYDYYNKSQTHNNLIMRLILQYGYLIFYMHPKRIRQTLKILINTDKQKLSSILKRIIS